MQPMLMDMVVVTKAMMVIITRAPSSNLVVLKSEVASCKHAPMVGLSEDVVVTETIDERLEGSMSISGLEAPVSLSGCKSVYGTATVAVVVDGSMEGQEIDASPVSLFNRHSV